MLPQCKPGLSPPSKGATPTHHGLKSELVLSLPWPGSPDTAVCCGFSRSIKNSSEPASQEEGEKEGQMEDREEKSKYP